MDSISCNEVEAAKIPVNVLQVCRFVLMKCLQSWPIEAEDKILLSIFLAWIWNSQTSTSISRPYPLQNSLCRLSFLDVAPLTDLVRGTVQLKELD